MTKNEISAFIAKSIEQVKSGLPQDCVINGNFDFEISVVTKKEGEAGVDIAIVNAGANYSQNTVHKIRFSITDRKSMEENVEYAKKIIHDFIQEFKEDFRDDLPRRNRRIRS